MHSGHPREGPGDNMSTRKAYLMLEDLPKEVRTFMKEGYPAIKTIKENMNVARDISSQNFKSCYDSWFYDGG